MQTEKKLRYSHIDTDPYLIRAAQYIHRNPLDVKTFGTVERLDDYQWSSYPHYRGLTQDNILDDEIFWKLFGGSENVAAFHHDGENLGFEDFEKETKFPSKTRYL